MIRDKSWQNFEDLISEYIKELDPHARPTKGSGNKGESHDIKTTCGLACELKERNLKSVYNEDWMQKNIEEVPLHSKDIPIVVTRNKENKIRVHMEWIDFWDLYVELYNLRKGRIDE